MGANHSKEELLYQAVRVGNHDVVKALRRDGASLEWIDKEGRTPLLLACSRLELLDMAITLLNLGANMSAYRSGSHGGYAIHHAAKRGLDKTVTLLLSRGANPMAINDDDQTPLDLARSRGHVSVVRMLEERLCLFSGMLKELSSFSFLESLAPNLVMKKIWAVVLPTKIFQEYELVIYESPKVCLWTGVGASSPHPAGLCNVAQPSTILPLSKVQMEKLIFNSKDLVVQITDQNKTKYKFMSEKKNDRAQVEKFYEACKGIPQGSTGIYADGASPQQGSISQIHPVPSSQLSTQEIQPVFQFISASSVSTPSAIKSTAEPMSEEIALALALDESIRTAAEEGIPLSPNSIAPCSDLCSNNSRTRYIKEWHDHHNTLLSESSSNNNNHNRRTQGNNSNIKQGPNRSKSLRYSRWSSWGPIMCGPTNTDVCVSDPTAKAPTPLPNPHQHNGNTNTNTNSNTKIVAEIKEIGTCVICWDASREGVCIPCGHLAGCMDCLLEVESKEMGCPVCRGPIEQVVKVYTV